MIQGRGDTSKSSCEGKQRFEKRELADKIVKRQLKNAKGRYQPPAQSIYRCAHCNNWHIGRPAPRRPKGKPA